MSAKKQKSFAQNFALIAILLGGLLGIRAVQSTINYNNAPPVGAFTAPYWIRIDVTSYVTGDGTYNFALTTPSSTAISFASRESGTNPPKLIIETLP